VQLPLTHLQSILKKTLNPLTIGNQNQKGALLFSAQSLHLSLLFLLRLKPQKPSFRQLSLQIITNNSPKPIMHKSTWTNKTSGIPHLGLLVTHSHQYVKGNLRSFQTPYLLSLQLDNNFPPRRTNYPNGGGIDQTHLTSLSFIHQVTR